MKKVVFAAMVLTLLLSFCTVLGDQDGRNCWCNIDEYGCWITGEDGGKNYIMFWSEEARVYIMGSGSAPYKYVVAKPGSAGMLPMECGSSASVDGAAAKQQEHLYDCDNFSVRECTQKCHDAYKTCVLPCYGDVCTEPCNSKLIDCSMQCDAQEEYCNNNQ